MDPSVSVKEVKILETAEDIQERREQGMLVHHFNFTKFFKKLFTTLDSNSIFFPFSIVVLKRYVEFKDAARIKREKLEDSRRYQYFRRDADELESWIYEKLQVASDESFKDATNLQAKIQKHQAFEAEVAANSNAIGKKKDALKN